MTGESIETIIEEPMSEGKPFMKSKEFIILISSVGGILLVILGGLVLFKMRQSRHITPSVFSVQSIERYSSKKVESFDIT